MVINLFFDFTKFYGFLQFFFVNFTKIIIIIDPVEEESEEEKCYQLSVKANVVNTEPVKNANDEIQDTKQEKNGN